MPDDTLRLMFLCTHSLDDGACVRGGILVADAHTKPLEFRCTDPIRPTSFQKILYGEALTQVVLIELVGVPLVGHCREKGKVVLVRESRLLPLRAHIDIPVLWVGKEEEWRSASEPIAKEEQIVCTLGSYEPIIVKNNPKFPKDADERVMLSDVFQNHDLLEPFERIAKALEQIHNQDKKKPSR